LFGAGDAGLLLSEAGGAGADDVGGGAVWLAAGGAD
jgi:hypothetical protein